MSENVAHGNGGVDGEIRSAVAARGELGAAYDDVVAEGLVERIGEEIDRRIDARLGVSSASRGPYTAPAPRTGGAGAPEWLVRTWSTLAVAVLSAGTGLVLTFLLAVVLGSEAVLPIIGVWMSVACANAGHSLLRDLAPRR